MSLSSKISNDYDNIHDINDARLRSEAIKAEQDIDHEDASFVSACRGWLQFFKYFQEFKKIGLFPKLKNFGDFCQSKNRSKSEGYAKKNVAYLIDYFEKNKIELPRFYSFFTSFFCLLKPSNLKNDDPEFYLLCLKCWNLYLICVELNDPNGKSIVKKINISSFRKFMNEFVEFEFNNADYIDDIDDENQQPDAIATDDLTSDDISEMINQIAKYCNDNPKQSIQFITQINDIQQFISNQIK